MSLNNSLGSSSIILEVGAETAKEECNIGMAGDGAEAFAGGCTIAACVVSTWHIYKHLGNYTEPMYQRYTVRIIFMIHVICK